MTTASEQSKQDRPQERAHGHAGHKDGQSCQPKDGANLEPIGAIPGDAINAFMGTLHFRPNGWTLWRDLFAAAQTFAGGHVDPLQLQAALKGRGCRSARKHSGRGWQCVSLIADTEGDTEGDTRADTVTPTRADTHGRRTGLDPETFQRWYGRKDTPEHILGRMNEEQFADHICFTFWPEEQPMGYAELLDFFVKACNALGIGQDLPQALEGTPSSSVGDTSH